MDVSLIKTDYPCPKKNGERHGNCIACENYTNVKYK
jgi:hypothetical protein